MKRRGGYSVSGSFSRIFEMKDKVNKKTVKQLQERLNSFSDEGEAVREFCLEIYEKVGTGEVEYGDFDLAIRGHKLEVPILIEMALHFKKRSANGISFWKARDLAQRWHFTVLAVIEKEFFDQETREEKAKETFPYYEELVDAIFEGNICEADLDILKKIKPYYDFDKELAIKIYEENSFQDITYRID